MSLYKQKGLALASLILLSAVTTHASNVPNSNWADKNVVSSLQSIPGDQFTGELAVAKPLRLKTRYKPEVLAYHRDSGNSRVDDYPGPLGQNVTVASSTNIKPAPLFWDDKGRLTAGAICNDTTTCIVALDPETFDILATWTGPTDQGSTIFFPSFTYSTMYQSRYITPVVGPRIIEVERSDTEAGTSFSVAKEWDLSGLVGAENQIINSAYDEDGNLWFSTGGFPGAGVGSTNTTAVIGYIEASGTIRHLVLPDARIENGVAMTGTTVYLNAAPAGANDVANATGHLYALQPSADGVKVLYNETYDSGSGMKLGGISRGSGSSPTLIGNEYVAITDNADTQISLNFFKQATSEANLISVQVGGGESGGNLACSVPVFRPNISASENTLLAHFDGTIYSAVVSGSYNAPPVINFFNSTTTLDDPAQYVTTAKPGLVRVDLDPRDNSCHVRWEVDLPMTGNPTLSTATGLVHHYHQDVELAADGEYAWYFTAIDWQSGETVWSLRAGTGALFNHHYQVPALSPDGAVYIYVQGGVVKVFDQPEA